CQHVARVRAGRFNFAADPLNERPHVIGFIAILPAPYGLEHLSMEYNLAGVACQIRQHLELAPCQPRVDSLDARSTSAEVTLQPLKSVRWHPSPRSGGDPSQQRIDARQQLRDP